MASICGQTLIFQGALPLVKRVPVFMESGPNDAPTGTMVGRSDRFGIFSLDGLGGPSYGELGEVLRFSLLDGERGEVSRPWFNGRIRAGEDML
jgi:hypothetical protein